MIRKILAMKIEDPALKMQPRQVLPERDFIRLKENSPS